MEVGDDDNGNEQDFENEVLLTVESFKGLENLSIEDKLFGITLDNASNNQVFINELSVQEFLKYLDQELGLSQLRQLLNKICASTQRCEKLSLACKNNSIDDLKPIIDVPTSYTLTEEQWNGLRKIVDFLELFKEVTAVISGSTYSTLFMMILLFNFLINHVEDIIGDENEKVNDENDDENDDENIRIEKSIKKAAKYCKDKLLKYYVKTNNVYSIAVILDLRLKIQYFKDEEWDDDLINEINQNFVNIFNSNYATTSLNSNISFTSKEKSVISHKFKTYIALPTVSGKTLDPLKWSRINETQYLQLSKMAHDYLAIPATSVPSEQCFSISKNLITNNRNCLIGKTIRISIYLKS
ncbi:hypothetical protein GLOIN_2v1783792 [Rhizophagus irregularis DAOM 181602=DAOM 197198]|uniref:HAT C-terminal dimerisation domain-containing protein n=1 Tax=Rhizophagus irregularis (strain DAOM 181602 / DAOM 197198 / MUCL 43194) TaxID=747089 RepID=A0A2P4PE46_RHIID|nr:hypothetical protein GLOIN_2v1783792 [Rhizophagus irregularis DAOM 181602=DAOM 197198]POG63663.1 hypothetical protein GLOIN_2v1783792 [Rhizophagus irregularis DAOM 181602=DAOM 197198]|eukprot:XP_025170529.1 hypothetical protein GLOIN_2v1783792 [Rhizophagus irregularis DAOM 181602=DAOM 197198]